MEINPHCSVCKEKFKMEDKVYLAADILFIQHEACFEWKEEFIKDKGTFEEIIRKYPKYFRQFIPKKKKQ